MLVAVDTSLCRHGVMTSIFPDRTAFSMLVAVDASLCRHGVMTSTAHFRGNVGVMESSNLFCSGLIHQ